MLRTSEAEAKARAFVKANFHDLPSTSFVMSRNYVEDEQRRNFEVRYIDANLGTTYVLIILSVHDDGTVELKKDRRESVRKQLVARGTFLPGPEFSGPMLLDLLMQAIEDPAAIFPEWFVGVRVQEGEDFDAIASIKSEDGTGLTFPVTLFRKKTDKAKFFKSYAGDPERRMGLIIPLGATPTDIRKRLIDQLTLQRKNHSPVHTMH